VRKELIPKDLFQFLYRLHCYSLIIEEGSQRSSLYTSDKLTIFNIETPSNCKNRQNKGINSDKDVIKLVNTSFAQLGKISQDLTASLIEQAVIFIISE
jgi:hypothetical protein